MSENSQTQKSTAQLRAEARERRLMQSDQRLARIKAMSQGKELPPLTNPTQEEEQATSSTNKSTHSMDQDVITTNSGSSIAIPTKPTTGKQATNKSQEKSTHRKKPQSRVPKSDPLNHSVSAATPQERMAAMQIQDRAYVTATWRWRVIHFLITTLVCVGLFVYVVNATAVIHVNGEEVIGTLMYIPHGEFRIPAVGIFNYFVGVECVLTAARYFLDSASINPPVSNVVQQLQMVAPAQLAAQLSGQAASPISSFVSTFTNAGFLFQLLVSDFCYAIMVFGIGIIACAYTTGLDEIRSLL